MRYKTPEEKKEEQARKERQELERLRNLKRNLESGVVMDIEPELMEILLTWDIKDL